MLMLISYRSKVSACNTASCRRPLDQPLNANDFVIWNRVLGSTMGVYMACSGEIDTPKVVMDISLPA